MPSYSLGPFEKWTPWQGLIITVLGLMSLTSVVLMLTMRISAKPAEVAKLPDTTKWIVPDSDWRVGDCFIYHYVQQERWDDPPMIRRIEEVGHLSYRVSMYAHEMWWPGILAAPMSDHKYMQRVECPE